MARSLLAFFFCGDSVGSDSPNDDDGYNEGGGSENGDVMIVEGNGTKY